MKSPKQKSNVVLIIGASGYIGNTLYKELLSYFDVYGTYFSQVGIFGENQVFFQYSVEEGGLDTILADLKPTVVISALKGNYEAQFAAHKTLVEYSMATNARILFLSTVHVFDGKGAFPSYENDKPASSSDVGRFKISVEKLLQSLPKENYTIIRLPLVLGVNSPIVIQLKQAIKYGEAFEVFPNLIVSVTTADKIAQQVHYIINKKGYGIYHLASKDIVHHEDLFKEVSEKISDKSPIFKSAYSSNEDSYLALLPKKNKLPKNYRITVAEVVEDSTLKEEIITLKK